MNNLTQAIAEYDAGKNARVPADILALMNRCTEELKASGIENRALRVGDRMPDFELPDQHGVLRRFSDYLKKAPVVLSIYRGGWCPYCNLEMKALAAAQLEIERHGALLVGMAPELPDKALETAANNGASFDILSDSGNRVSERLGLVFTLHEALRPIYERFGLDIPAYNGDRTFKLPMPATYVVDRDGTIVHAFVDADYTRRLEPAEILRVLAARWPIGR
ncbi:putative peroxiredoxin bcp [mine drainage metagenome]|uniref:thioredoxin-dependent peroxiredoxin n=1 Tax=mine drainage metagenome TaxID=410659 RepID=A0A1J5S9V2_9ZZZZ